MELQPVTCGCGSAIKTPVVPARLCLTLRAAPLPRPPSSPPRAVAEWGKMTDNQKTAYKPKAPGSRTSSEDE